MGKVVLWLAFSVLAFASLSFCLELDSFLLETLDDTRLALETTRETESVHAKRVVFPKAKKVVTHKKTRWGSSRRRRFSVRRTRYTRVNKGRPGIRPRPKPTKRAPLNKHLQATNQIEKGIKDAGAMLRGQNINSLKQHIQSACSSKEYVFARQMLGHTIYNFAKAEFSRRRGRRAATSPAKTILYDIKKRIGDDKFKSLMALDGMVTLAFAMDTTGSMRTEMKHSVAIATDIVNWPRAFDVDYILSPFNDPPQSLGYTIQHGPASYYKTSEKSKFLTMLKSLKANGGGDCEELAIEGIQNIFSSSIQYQSPIYVFTDAGAKDASEDNVDALKVMADGYQLSINFFLSNAGCMNKKAIALYESLAEATGGQILYFAGSQSTLNKMSNFVTNGLIGGTNIPVIPKQNLRRSIGSTEYAIQVDNSMDTLSATVMTSASSRGIQLRSPAGTLQLNGKTDTGKGSLFLVKKPSPGVWKLTVPPTRDGHFVTARAVSDENIDFEYFFIVENKLGRKSKQVFTKSPLKGKQASVVITVPAHAKTIPSSYKIHVVNKAFKLPKTVSITQKGRSSGRYAGNFYPPSHDFKLILEGKTKEGTLFKRTCPGIVKPSTALIHVFSAPRGFVMTAGSSRTTTVVFAANNFGPTEAFDVKIKELKPAVQRYNKRLFVVSGRMALFPVVFKAPRNAKRGSTHEVVVSVVGQRSRARASMLVQLLVV